jgi:hypothetical protein
MRPPFIRNVLVRLRQREISVVDDSRELGVSRSRLYVLYAGYLRACARRIQSFWSPGHSDGDHHPAWPREVCDLLRKLLGARPPASYALAASEEGGSHQHVSSEPVIASQMFAERGQAGGKLPPSRTKLHSTTHRRGRSSNPVLPREV